MKEYQNNKQPFMTIKTIYYAMMLGVIVFGAVIYYTAKTPAFNLDVNDIFIFIVPVLLVLGIFASNFIYKSLIAKIDTNLDLQTKIAQYTSATIIKGTLLELPALLAVVVASFTDNMLFLIFALLMLFVMYTKVPAKEKFEEEVPLTFNEKSELNSIT